MIRRNGLGAAARLSSQASGQRLLLSTSSSRLSSTHRHVAAQQPGSLNAAEASSSSSSEAGKKKSGAALVKSSVVAGTPLKGLNFEKNKADPVALADDEYPAWLWTILQRQEKTAEGTGGGDLFSKSKKQRRVAAKRLRKEQALNPHLLAPKIPIYQQTIDLPAGNGTLAGAVHALAARAELTKAMRDQRRAHIKEKNFLKAMG
ncbi:hypothetical protein ACEQ8H_000766 [Pleosporales sp. CAS-2024a]